MTELEYFEQEGGPAFPFVSQGSCASHQACDSGMSLRDYFASSVLPKVYDHLKHSRPNDIADLSYEIADAMLVSRKTRKS